MLPTIVKTETTQEESGLMFKVIEISTDDYNTIDVKSYVTSSLCKLIVKDKNFTRTHYFKKWEETSIDKIVQEERIKQLRR